MKILKALFFIGLSHFLIACQPEPPKPNILFILSDDQGWGDVHAHGNELIDTPNLDRLIAEGTELEQFYVSPLCAPTRASLLTGRYHLKTGATSVSNGLEIMDADETTIAEIFKANGYKTGIFGKWHNGSHYPNRPTDQGFEEFIGFCAGHLSNYFNSPLDSGITEITSKGYITDYLATKAMNFIEKNKEKPFFCYVPFNAPHSPFQVPDAYFDKYKAKGLDDELASIYGMVENLDFNIGRLLKKLEEEGLAENTIVVFMTDNGPNGHRYNGLMKGIKGQVDEGGVRVPAMIKWKGKIEKNKKIKSLAAHIDWLPTLVELCQLKPIPTKSLDGISLAQTLLNKEPHESNRSIFSHVAFLEKELKPEPGTFRTGQYRFVFKEKGELYDMLKDPSQEKNIALQFPELVNEMVQSYISWFHESSKNYVSTKPISLQTNFIELPAYEAEFTGSVHFKEGHGWAHDWLTDWKKETDSISWLTTNSENQKMQADWCG